MEKKRKNIMTKANRNQKANKNQSEKRRNISPKPASVFSVQKGQEMELEITGLGSAGEGVGRYRDIAVFVPGARKSLRLLRTGSNRSARFTKSAEAASCSICLTKRS